MTVQFLLVYLVLAAAVGYALWMIVRALRHADDPCYGCSGCALKELKKGKDCDAFRSKIQEK